MQKRGKNKSKKRHNKLFSLIMVMGIFVLLTAGIYAVLIILNPGHSPEEIIVTIDNCDVTLQSAIDNNYLKGTATPTTCLLKSEFPKTYHLASEITVTIDSYTLTLQDVINQNYFKGTDIISSSTSLPSKGHSANNVEVTVNSIQKTLQDTLSELRCVLNTCIDLGYECGTWDDACGGTLNCSDCGPGSACSEGSCILTSECTPGQTEPTDCDSLDRRCRNYNDVTNTCDSSGYWTNPPCNSYVNTARGTNCFNDKSCDGAGNCEGYSGKGCGGCPFGTANPGSLTNQCILPPGYKGRWGESETNFLSWRTSGNILCSYRYCCRRNWLGMCRSRCTDYYAWQIKPN